MQELYFEAIYGEEKKKGCIRRVWADTYQIFFFHPETSEYVAEWVLAKREGDWQGWAGPRGGLPAEDIVVLGEMIDERFASQM